MDLKPTLHKMKNGSLPMIFETNISKKKRASRNKNSL